MVAHAHIMRVRAGRAGPKGLLGSFLGSFWVGLGRFGVVLGRVGSLVRSKALIIIQSTKRHFLLVLSAQQRSSAAAPGDWVFFRH